MGQIFLTVSYHRDHSILYALVCEKQFFHMGRNSGNGGSSALATSFLVVQNNSGNFSRRPYYEHLCICYR